MIGATQKSQSWERAHPPTKIAGPVLLAGLTTLPRTDWWQNSLTSPALTAAALTLRPWLPKVWAERLDYGPRERRPAKSVVKTVS